MGVPVESERLSWGAVEGGSVSQVDVENAVP